MEIAGLKVVDARKPLTIKITPHDVAKGNNKDPGGCAAALAVKRTTKCMEARVHIGRTYIKTKTEAGKEVWTRYYTPKALRTEIVAFDRGAAFDPGEYRLIPMPPAQRLGRGVGSNTSRNRPDHKKVARIKHHAVTGVRHHGP